jgi:hypothetical protein
VESICFHRHKSQAGDYRDGIQEGEEPVKKTLHCSNKTLLEREGVIKIFSIHYFIYHSEKTGFLWTTIFGHPNLRQIGGGFRGDG